MCICSEKRTGTLVCPYFVQSVTCANGQTQSEAVLAKRASLFLCPASVSVLHPIWTAVRGRCSSTRAGSIAVRGAAFCKGILVLIVYSPAVLCSWPHHATDHVNNGKVITRQLVQIVLARDSSVFSRACRKASTAPATQGSGALAPPGAAR